MNKKCLKAYKPHKEVTVDEAMIAFRGRLSFRQYLPAKPTKYRIKVWVRADSNNGFVNEFQIYIGKPAGAQHEVGLGKRVVLHLTEKIRDKRHHVFIDNYFNSVELIEELLSRNLYGCGTVRSNMKDLPEQMRLPTRKHWTEKNNNRPAAHPLKLQPEQSKQSKHSGNCLAGKEGKKSCQSLVSQYRSTSTDVKSKSTTERWYIERSAMSGRSSPVQSPHEWH